MSRRVFANGKEVSAKKDGNKSRTCAPDMCFSPPTPPPTGVPVPYVNSASASDTTSGSKSVKIGGAEVGKKNVSKYKKSVGDKPATQGLPKGVISHNIEGPMKHAAWSMDVMVEGKNAIRHQDFTTHNHLNMANDVGQDKAKDQKGDHDDECTELKEKADKEDERIRRKIAGKKYKTTRKGEKYRVKKRGRPRIRKETVTAEQRRQAALDAHKATTVTASKAKCGDKVMYKNGYSSSSKLPTKNRNELAKGIKKGEDSNLCEKGDDKFKHAEDSRTSSCQHTEGKFIEDLFKKPPEGFADKNNRVNCTLTMSIKWKQRKRTEGGGWRSTKPEQIPCDNCEKTICRASFCGLTVWICIDGKKTKPNFCKKHGYTSADGKK